MECGALEETVDAGRIGAIARAPQAFFRPVEARPDDGAGVRPMKPDGLPFLGRFGG